MGAKKRRVQPLDAVFLWGESPETMMHVASLMPVTPPEGAGPEYLREVYEQMLEAPVAEPWNQRLAHPHFLRHPRQAWVEDENFDIDYHVRRSALPSPGDERELGIVVSRLHSHQLDFRRPPWEVHLIEGLEGGRFAVYTKIHHSLVDGYTGARIQQKSMSPDPDDRSAPFFYSIQPWADRPPRDSSGAEGGGGLLALPKRAVGTAVSVSTGATRLAAAAARSTFETTRAVARLERAAMPDDSDLVDPFSAPTTIFSGRTSRNRRLATQQFDMARVKKIATEAGGTLNDVVMAICGGGLRSYLGELEELPKKPLIAFMPVNLRSEGDEGGGNLVGVSLAHMGTHIEDPKRRLESVISSTRQAKEQMKGMQQLAALAYSGYLLTPAGAQVLGAMTGLEQRVPQTINVVVSNVPGPKSTMYMRGGKVEAIYPVSIPTHGMALNITMESYDGTLCFAFIGCRDAVPSLQKLAVATGDSLEALAEAYGVA